VGPPPLSLAGETKEKKIPNTPLYPVCTDKKTVSKDYPSLTDAA
jgi:hypothetical protein